MAEYPKLSAVHYAVDCGGGAYLATIDIAWEDGKVERCPYSYILGSGDEAPIHKQLLQLHAEGRIPLRSLESVPSLSPVQAVTSGSDVGEPDVIA